MKFYIQSRSDDLSNELMATARGYLQEFGMEWNEESPQIVLSIGGDGTLLHAFHKYSDRLNSVAFVGIHTGHLGFYADWKPIEIEKLVVDGETGRLVAIEQAQDGTGTPVDPEKFVADFAAALTEVVSDPVRAREMGAAGRRRAEEHFAWESIAERTLEVYRSVL